MHLENTIFNDIIYTCMLLSCCLIMFNTTHPQLGQHFIYHVHAFGKY